MMAQIKAFCFIASPQVVDPGHIMRIERATLQPEARKNPRAAGKPAAASASKGVVPPMLDASEPRVGAGESAGGEEDRALMARVAARDEAAFERLVARHAQAVTRLTRRLLGYAGDTEDIVQDVFARVWERATDFRSD